MLDRSRPRVLGCVLVACLSLASIRSVEANGAFPAAGQILVDPTDPARIWVNTSVGFALTRDGGQTFHLLCTDGIGYSGFFHPHAGITPTGALFMGVANGVAVGRGDTCGFTLAPEMVGLFVVDVSVDPQGRAIAVGVPEDGGQAVVFRSEDDLATWAQLGDDLPANFTPRTLDAAPSDPDVVYVSGLDESTNEGKLVVTTDAGNSWTELDVPGSDSADVAPFIAAVDPDQPAVVYVRLGGTPGRLMRSVDSGTTFTQILELPGFMYAFRLAADGSSAYVGTDQSGLHRLDTASLTTEPLAGLSARCVTLDGDRVLACGDETSDGFSAGISLDDGLSFETMLRLSCIEGILPCPTGSTIEATCAPKWPMIDAFLEAGLACDAPDPGTGGGGAGEGASSQGANGEGAGSAAAGGSPGNGSGGGASQPESGDGCSCVAAQSRAAPESTWLCAALIAACLRRARSNRAHDPANAAKAWTKVMEWFGRYVG